MSTRPILFICVSILIYLLELRGHSDERLLQPLFLVQKLNVRIITFSVFLAHTASIYSKLGLLPLTLYDPSWKALMVCANNVLGVIIYKIIQRGS